MRRGDYPSVPTFSVSSTVGIVADYTLFCTNSFSEGIFNTNFDFFLSTSELNTGVWSLTQASNTYSGTYVTATDIGFTGVTWDTGTPTLSFELHGVQVNPSASPLGYQYYETSSVNGPPLSQISNDLQLVAVNAAPEPSTFGLAALALAAAGIRRATSPRKSGA